MSVDIRQSQPADAAAITAIAEAAFGESFNQARIEGLLQLGRIGSFVALDGRGILAFADSFVTFSETGRQRLELDLLAVEAQARGMGIGRLLVAECLRAARAIDAPLLRTLVRNKNLAMRRLCAACGFAISEQSYDLYVASAGPGPIPAVAVDGVHLVPVETFAYSGIWIEGDLTRAGICWALSVAQARQLGTVGALVSQRDPGPGHVLSAAGFDQVGTYDWWTMHLKSG